MPASKTALDPARLTDAVERLFSVLRHGNPPNDISLTAASTLRRLEREGPRRLTELAELTRTAMRVIRAASNPHGFNIGMNQGGVAGAGIAAHLHQHVVPRWGGDANFMPVIGRTKVLPQLLGDTRDLLAKAWAEITTTR